jgi:hypothetical protein
VTTGSSESYDINYSVLFISLYANREKLIVEVLKVSDFFVNFFISLVWKKIANFRPFGIGDLGEYSKVLNYSLLGTWLQTVS